MIYLDAIATTIFHQLSSHVEPPLLDLDINMTLLKSNFFYDVVHRKIHLLILMM